MRQPHYRALIEAEPDAGFLEAHAENHMGGGMRAAVLEWARRRYPLSIHGVGLSLGGTESVDPAHLDRFADLVARTEPFLVSEHVAWCRQDGVYLNDLLPLPYTEEALAVLARNVQCVQERLKRKILMENPATYLKFADSRIPEGEFLAELARRSGCGILLDVNNLYVNQRNHGISAMAVIERLAPESVGEIHLAGHHEADLGDAVLLIDNHGSPVAEPVWQIYAETVLRFPRAATLVEWDSDIPMLQTLIGEARQADLRRASALREAVHAEPG